MATATLLSTWEAMAPMALDDICECGNQKRFHQPTTGHEFKDKYALPDEDDLGGFLANLKEQIAELKAMQAPLINSQADITAELDRIEAERLAARLKERAVADSMKAINLQLQKIDAASFLASQRIMQQEAVAMARAALQEAATQFELCTAGAWWRNFAYEFQIEDATTAALAKRCIIANTMGTGKTGISTIICDMLESKRVIVFTPATVVRPFIKEIKKWSPKRTVKSLSGLTRDQKRDNVEILLGMKEMGMGFTVVLNYESMRKDSSFIELLKMLEFDTIILDEAHSFKDKKSLTFRQIKEIVNGDGHQIPNVFPMTGSPILNKPQDLWPLLNIIAPYDFYDEYQFLRGYCTQDYTTGKWRFTSSGLNGLQRKLRDKFIRRTKEQTGISLPEKTFQTHTIELDPATHPRQFQANKDLNGQAMLFLADESKAMSITTTLALITRKRQMMTMPSGMVWKNNDPNHPVYAEGEIIFKCDVDESVKLDYIIHANGNDDSPSWSDPAGLLPDLVSDEKVVIFSQFKAPLHELQARCTNAGITSAVIDGDTPMDERERIINTFQTSALGVAGGIDVVIGNYKAMGVGVTLTAASQMIILDEEWSPGKNEQAYDRIHRFGQEKAVTIHILRVENSIDDWMAELIEEKKALVDGFNNTVPANASDLMAKLKDGML